MKVNADAIPDELKDRDQWLLWDNSDDTPKQPHWKGNFQISWSNPDDWHSFDEAVSAAAERENWGIGYVNALDNDDYGPGVYGCIDIDGAVIDRGNFKDWMPTLEPFIDAGAYMEYSPSTKEHGEDGGIHIPVVGREPPKWWADTHFSDDEHEGVEYLTNKFVTFTGDTLESAGSDVADLDITEWLFEAYYKINGEHPRLQDATGSDYKGTDEWLDDQQVRDALDELDPDMSHNEWVKVGYAVHDYDDGSRGKQLFTEWSKRGSKWDRDAEQTVDHIWSSADAGSGVTVGTLVHKATNEGWTPATADGRGGTAHSERTTDDGPGISGETKLEPAYVEAWAGVGEDEGLDSLTDREKAASVWALLKGNDDYHVRVRRDNAELLAYENGVWKPTGDRALRHAGKKALGAMHYGGNVLEELKAQARADPSREVDPDQLGTDTGKIAVANGLLDLEAAAEGDEGALRELEPNDYALAKLPVEYDPSADYDKWSEYVDEWAEDGKADALQEYVGYCLHVGDLPIHRALLLVGSGANGKGTFLSVVRELLGRENTTSIELQTLANERDAVAQFYGSIANIDDDLSARKLGNGLGMFKKLVGGDRVRGRRLYEEGFEFDATGKHLYAANEVPDVNVPDDDEAFWRRWLLVEFPNHYPPSERDPSLSDELTTDDALSGVLNWAIEGWARLMENSYFTGEERYAHAKRERWQAWGDSVDKFINECVEKDEDADNITTSDAHRVYSAWCRKNDERPASQQKLTNALKSEGVGYNQSVRVNGSVQRGYKALGFTEAAPELEETPDRGRRDEKLT